jgi:hypothetical protein
MKRNLKILIILTCAFAAQSQIPNPIKGKGITVGGMLGANHTYYNATGIPNRNIPFNFLYTGNLSVTLFDKIKMPVAFSFSNQNINFSHPFDRNYRFAQPFNRLILKPTYKGLTLHLGTAALNFSPYTLAGHRFDGVGIEYKPKNQPFYVAAMTGNLQRAVAIDTAFAVRNNRPSYKRTGHGFMAGLKKKSDKIELIFFNAKDKINALAGTLDMLNINPVENSVFAFKAEKILYKKYQIGGEIAYSGITTDSRADPRVGSDSPFLMNFLGTINAKTSTEYLKAIKSFVNYNDKTFTTGFEYSRVDPGYRTLGAYFFTNDLESFSLKIASKLMDGKLTMAGNGGIQRDNVWKQKPKTLSRNVGSLNLTYVPSEKLVLVGTYSNFSSFSNLLPSFAYLTQVTPYNYLDTLNFRQINSNLQSNMTWTMPSNDPNLKHTLSAMAILQQGADQQGNANTDNNMNNLNLDYGFENAAKHLGGNVTVNYTKTNFGGAANTQLGPSLGFNFEKYKVKNTISMLYAWGNMPGVKEHVANIRYGASYALKDKHQLKLDLIYLNRQAQSTERSIPSFRELTISLGYVYNFKLLDKKIK